MSTGADPGEPLDYESPPPPDPVRPEDAAEARANWIFIGLLGVIVVSPFVARWLIN